MGKEALSGAKLGLVRFGTAEQPPGKPQPWECVRRLIDRPGPSTTRDGPVSLTAGHSAACRGRWSGVATHGTEGQCSRESHVGAPSRCLGSAGGRGGMVAGRGRLPIASPTPAQSTPSAATAAQYGLHRRHTAALQLQDGQQLPEPGHQRLHNPLLHEGLRLRRGRRWRRRQCGHNASSAWGRVSVVVPWCRTHTSCSGTLFT